MARTLFSMEWQLVTARPSAVMKKALASAVTSPSSQYSSVS